MSGDEWAGLEKVIIRRYPDDTLLILKNSFLKHEATRGLKRGLSLRGDDVRKARCVELITWPGANGSDHQRLEADFAGGYTLAMGHSPASKHIGPDVSIAGDMLDDVAEGAMFDCLAHEFTRFMPGHPRVSSVRIQQMHEV